MAGVRADGRAGYGVAGTAERGGEGGADALFIIGDEKRKWRGGGGGRHGVRRCRASCLPTSGNTAPGRQKPVKFTDRALGRELVFRNALVGQAALQALLEFNRFDFAAQMVAEETQAAIAVDCLQ